MSTTPTNRNGLDGFFAAIRDLGIRRDPKGRWFAGVCTGIARRFAVDPVLVRAALIVLLLFGGFGVTAYLAAWLLLPDEDGSILAEKAIRHGDGGGIVLAVIVAISVFGNQGDWWRWTGLVPLALILWWVFSANHGGGRPIASSAPGASPGVTEHASYTSAGTAPDYPSAGTEPAYPGPAGSPAYPGMTSQPTPVPTYPALPPRPVRPRAGAPWTLIVLGLALAGFGVGYAGSESGLLLGEPWFMGSLVALGILGVACLAIGLWGRRAGFLGTVATTLALVVGSAALLPTGLRFDQGVGERSWHPLTAVESSYELSVGDATLDLSDVSTTVLDGTTVTVSLGVGELTVIPPAGMTAEVTGDVSFGNMRSTVTAEPFDLGGTHPHRTLTLGTGTERVVIDASVVLGQLVIKEPR